MWYEIDLPDGILVIYLTQFTEISTRNWKSSVMKSDAQKSHKDFMWVNIIHLCESVKLYSNNIYCYFLSLFFFSFFTWSPIYLYLVKMFQMSMESL